MNELKGIHISGENRVFKNKEGFYSIGISKKNQETGEYEKKYLPISFKKGVELENSMTDIMIIDGFLSFNEWIDKKTNEKKSIWKIIVLDFKQKNDDFSDNFADDFEDEKPF